MNTGCQGWSGGWSARTYWTRGKSTEWTVSDVERRGTAPGLLGTELEYGTIRGRGCDRRDAHHALFGMTRRSIGRLDVRGDAVRRVGVEQQGVEQRRSEGENHEQQKKHRSPEHRPDRATHASHPNVDHRASIIHHRSSIIMPRPPQR